MAGRRREREVEMMERDGDGSVSLCYKAPTRDEVFIIDGQANLSFHRLRVPPACLCYLSHYLLYVICFL